MGGVAKKATGAFKKPVKTFSNFAGTVFTAGLNKTNLGKGFFKKVGDGVGDILTLKRPGSGDDEGGGDDGGGGDFQLDPRQIKANTDAISNLGVINNRETNEFINEDRNTRQAQRDNLAKALIQQNQTVFQQNLPSTLEDLNARGLLNGSGVGQEIARKQGDIAANIADEIGTVGARDIDLDSQRRAASLAGLQGSRSDALQRQFSLEDFIRQSNVAKAMGAQMAPQVNNGKGNVVSGMGAGAAAGAPFGPWGAAIGGAGGALIGASGRRGK